MFAAMRAGISLRAVRRVTRINHHAQRAAQHQRKRKRRQTAAAKPTEVATRAQGCSTLQVAPSDDDDDEMTSMKERPIVSRSEVRWAEKLTSSHWERTGLRARYGV
jgi:hypothetical protein